MSSNKKYPLDNKAVFWQPEKCQHAAACVKNLGKVFKPKEKPWVQTENATEQEIIDTVAKCPSGALSIVDKDE